VALSVRRVPADDRKAGHAFGGALVVAVSAALLANALDAVTTYFAIMIVLKGAGLLLVLGIAAVGTDGAHRWWRARSSERWLTIVALWIAATWFGYLAVHNALGMWAVSRFTRR
jgi:hypothetical protein